MPKNPICQSLGIRYPILLGGLLNIGRARLVAAVSEAGGLGILGAGRWNDKQLMNQISQVRGLTDRPFGVNIVIRSPYVAEQVKVVIEKGIRVVTTSAGDVMRYTPRLKENGVYVIHVVPTVEHALKAQKAGVDAIVAEGSESGGFTSLEELSTFVLVPQVVDAVACPVLAAGGIGDGRGVAAALALGALGVQLGTRFLSTEECIIPEAYKLSIIMANDSDTSLVRSKRAAHRELKKDLIARAMAQTEGDTAKKAAELQGEQERLSWEGTGKPLPVWSAGQVAGLIHEVLPVNCLIDRIVREAGSVVSLISRRAEWLVGDKEG